MRKLELGRDSEQSKGKDCWTLTSQTRTPPNAPQSPQPAPCWRKWCQGWFLFQETPVCHLFSLQIRWLQSLGKMPSFTKFPFLQSASQCWLTVMSRTLTRRGPEEDPNRRGRRCRCSLQGGVTLPLLPASYKIRLDLRAPFRHGLVKSLLLSPAEVQCASLWGEWDLLSSRFLDLLHSAKNTELPMSASKLTAFNEMILRNCHHLI